MFQRTIGRISSIASGHEHDPKALSQIMLVLAHNLSQPPPDTIANDCGSEAARGDKAHPRRAASPDCCHTEHEQLATPHHAISFHAFVFRGAR
jgi:hypothetical protein